MSETHLSRHGVSLCHASLVTIHVLRGLLFQKHLVFIFCYADAHFKDGESGLICVLHFHRWPKTELNLVHPGGDGQLPASPPTSST